MSREVMRISPFLQLGNQAVEWRTDCQGTRERDYTRRARDIERGEPARVPAEEQDAEIGAGKGDPGAADDREQAPGKSEGVLVQPPACRVIVENDNSAALLQKAANIGEQIAKLGKILGGKVAEAKIELGRVAERLPVQFRSEHPRGDGQAAPGKRASK